MVPKVSNLETSAWKQRSIERSTSGTNFKSNVSNAICLINVIRSQSCDTISFVKLVIKIVNKSSLEFPIGNLKVLPGILIAA